MTTKNLLLSTLLATGLTLGATTTLQSLPKAQTQSFSISTQIVSSLYSKGLEEEKAYELTLAMINTDEELFTFMVQNFSHKSDISMGKISHELGKIALNRKKADFSSYSFLIKLTQSIKKEHLSSQELSTLESIAARNQLIFHTFS